MKTILCVLLVLSAAVGLAMAQASASYRLTEAFVGFGGDPANGTFAASSSYEIRLDAIGGAALGAGVSSAGYRVQSGFAAGYPPPREVRNQRWTSNETMVWDPDGSVGSYSLYRGLTAGLPDGFGACLLSSFTGETATDPSVPPLGSAWFYIVTARNALGEEGTKGFGSNGTERPNPSPCP